MRPDADRNALVERHMHLVRPIAEMVVRRLPAGVLSLDDAIGAGNMGLIYAARLYEARHGASFQTFASRRIRGQILDWIRDTHPQVRFMQKFAGKRLAAMNAHVAETGHDPSDDEAAERMGMSLDEYRRSCRWMRAGDHQHLSGFAYEDANGDSVATSVPDEKAGPSDARMASRERIEAILRGLPIESRLILRMRFVDEMTCWSIGQAIGVTESRVSQVIKLAIDFLRERAKVA